MKTEQKRIQERLPEFFAHPAVIAVICILVGLFLLYAINFCCQMGVTLWDSVKSRAMPQWEFPALLQWNIGKFKWIYLAGLVFAAGVSLRLAYAMRLNLEPLHGTHQKGSRDWTTLEELREQYRCIPDFGKPFEGKGGFPIAKYGNCTFIDDSPVNTVVIGSTRSGKGEVFGTSTVDIYSRPKRQEDRASLIIADPKGEQAAMSIPVLKERGYDTQVFDLIELMGLSFNPMEYVIKAYLQGNAAEAQLLVNTISFVLFHDPAARDKTWQNWNIALNNALCCAVLIDCCKEAERCGSREKKQGWYNKINLYSAARLLIGLCEPEEDESGKPGGYAIDRFFASREPDDIARIQYAAVSSASGRTKGNIYANALSVLTKFTMEPVARMTSKNNVDLTSIGFHKDHPTAVFLVMPDYDHSKDFLATLFINQLYYALSKQASVTKGGRCSREVIFLLDEFGNLPAIPDMAGMVSVGLGRGIHFILMVQAYSQIYKLYGQEDAKTILGNCGNHVYLLTIELETAKRFSELIGNKTITSMSRCGTPMQMEKHITSHIDTQPLLNPNELMELKPGESVVVRITKRTDLKGRKIIPKPIYNHGATQMKYRYEYLGRQFDHSRSLGEMSFRQECGHSELSLETILYMPKVPSTQSPAFQEMNAFFDSLDSEEPANQAGAECFIGRLPARLQDKLLNFLENLALPAGLLEQLSTISQAEFDGLLQHLEEESRITPAQREDIYTIIKEGK